MNDAEYNEQYNIDVDIPEVEGYRDDDVSLSHFHENITLIKYIL